MRIKIIRSHGVLHIRKTYIRLCTWCICNKNADSLLLFKILSISHIWNVTQNNIFTLDIAPFQVATSLLRIGSIGDRPESAATWLCICQSHNSLQDLLHVRPHSKSPSHLAHILLTSGLSLRRNYSASLVYQFRPC